MDGYHTDKTVVYYYGDLDQDPSVINQAAYEHCVFLEELTASMLQPGMVIENIYRQVMEQFDPQYENGFMNGGKFFRTQYRVGDGRISCAGKRFQR